MELARQHLLSADPVLGEIIGRVGPCILMKREPNFETLARSITFQQLSGKAAGTIFSRVQKAVGRRFTARGLLKLSPEELRACGLSRQKIASLTDLAERVVRREIDFRRMPELPDEAIIESLCQVQGIGVWTVQMFLMFALERPNILPLSDLGIRNAVRKAYGLESLPKAAELSSIAARWHPYCTVASWYLWRSLDGAAEL